MSNYDKGRQDKKERGETMTDQELKECIAEVKYSAIPEQSKKKITNALMENQQKIGWIPCSERLPDEIDKYYLVTYRSVICGEFEHGTTISYLSTFSNEDKSWEIEEEHGNNWIVIAWMPLPKPYKESEKTVREMENLEARR